MSTSSLAAWLQPQGSARCPRALSGDRGLPSPPGRQHLGWCLTIPDPRWPGTSGLHSGPLWSRRHWSPPVRGPLALCDHRWANCHHRPNRPSGASPSPAAYKRQPGKLLSRAKPPTGHPRRWRRVAITSTSSVAAKRRTCGLGKPSLPTNGLEFTAVTSSGSKPTGATGSTRGLRLFGRDDKNAPTPTSGIDAF